MDYRGTDMAGHLREKTREMLTGSEGWKRRVKGQEEAKTFVLLDNKGSSLL